jgi:hypothetical protein
VERRKNLSPLHGSLVLEIHPRLSGVLLNSRRRVSDPLPPSATLPLTEGENRALQAFNLPLVRGRRERSERGGRSHIILNYS